MFFLQHVRAIIFKNFNRALNLKSTAIKYFKILHRNQCWKMAVMKKIGNDTEIDRILNRDFVSVSRTGYVEVGEDKFCMPVYYQDYEARIRKFEVNDDDVFLTGHPKTGTTWAQEMIWLIINNLDYAEAAKETIFKRSPQLEFAALFDFTEFMKHDKDSFYLDPLAAVEQCRRPRCIKSHLHWSLLPEQIRNGTKQPKIITIVRNAADTCVSLYHHSQTIDGYKGTFEDFCELFLAGRVCFGPFWEQVLSYWEERDRPNILFIKYKEMKDDLPAVIRKVSQFLGKSVTEDQVGKLSQHLSFNSMKNNPSVNLEKVTEVLKQSGLAAAENDFVRSGKVGGYKSKMSPELVARFEVWMRENLAGTGLSVE